MLSFAFGFIYKAPICISRGDTIVLVKWPEEVRHEILKVAVANVHLSWGSGTFEVALEEYDFTFVGQHDVPAYDG